MESAAVLPNAVVSDASEQEQPRPLLRRGRFSTGIEQLADKPSSTRLGSFADGYEHISRR